MNIDFFQAKNGELTAKSNSLFLHSSYSPSNEAKRFVENLSFTFSPEYIILCEPCLNYIYSFIKEKYNNSKIGIIRFSHDFDKYNFDCNFVLYYENKSNFEDILLNKLGEENLCSTAFVTWEPTSKLFSENTSNLFISIKAGLEKAKTLLVTREYFEKKWLLNTCHFIANIRNTFLLKSKLNLPVLIIASGPSLKSKLQMIKENQNRFFIICLSSAISTLLYNNIKPDLCFSTDGGYWAGQHLKKNCFSNIPLALSYESFCPSNILKNNKIVPLFYDDGFTKSIINKSCLSGMDAIRNGTVSGTALDFALSNFTSNIYFFGLDLSTSNGFQHTQPNEIELNSTLKDFRINSLEKRSFISSLNSSSLKIYENWFINKKIPGKNVFRIINSNEKNNSFIEIKDLSLQEFEKEVSKYSIIDKTFESFFKKTDCNIASSTSSFILNELEKDENLKQLFPLDYVSLSHNNSDKNIITDRILEKKEKLITKIRKIFNEF